MSNFVDSVEIEIVAGNGGDGVVAWRREKYVSHGGPFGGDGGRGGDVILRGSASMNTLLDFRFKRCFEAQNGQNGAGARRSGRAGQDLCIDVPIGTVVYDSDSGEQLVDIIKAEQVATIAKGGRGGRGNQHFATPTDQAPSFCEPGRPGARLKLRLELKLIAHIGIIGLPNAGKSTLISRLTSCRPKIGNYPFTTLEPNLGIMQLGEGLSLTLADIPGLISGAAEGRGLGFQFLRHIERTRALIHVVDVQSVQQTDVPEANAYQIIREELAKYEEEILSKPEVIILNKIDLISSEELDSLIKTFKSASNISTECKIIPISAATGENLDELRDVIKELNSKFNFTQEAPDLSSAANTVIQAQPVESLKIEDLGGAFRVHHSELKGWIRVTKFSDPGSVSRLYSKLRELGLFDRLIECGIKTGDTVIVGTRELIWSDFADDKLV